MNKYQEIVKASAKIFKAKGYHAATVKDIAEEVGMLKGSLYYHIQSKEQLLIEVLLSAVEVLRGGLSEVLSSGLSPQDKLKQAIMSHTQAFLNNEELHVFYSELSKLPAGLRKKINAAFKDYEDLWLKILLDGVAAGVIRNDLPPRIMQQAVIGMCNWTYRWFRPAGRLSPAEIGEMFYQIILEGIKK